MKQQYIRSAWRGKKLGETLVEKIITEAREIRYSYMVLDTLPFLQNAIRLYKKKSDFTKSKAVTTVRSILPFI